MSHYRKTYTVPIYGCKLTVIVGDSDKLSDIAGMVGFKDTRIDEFNAVTVAGSPGNIGVLITNDSSVGLIAHESIHIKNNIFIHVGIKPDRHNDEAEAYLIGWIAGTIFDHVNKFKKTKK